MVLISIEEVYSNEQDIFHATVSFNHGPKYPLTIQNPFTSEQERELEWYFEEHLHFPFTNQIRARDAATSIRTYGESLFNQVFTDRQAYSVYKQCLQSGLPTLQIEIAGSPTLHSLHWEALKDPDLPMPLSLQAIIVRKNLHPSALQAQVRPSPILNLLIVTARPSGKRDVGYRTISRPLVELLRQTDLPVQIEILRPGTYEALDRHLQETTIRNGVGYYQIIHFDVHGAVLSFEEFQQAQQADRFLYQNRYGRHDITPYEGAKAFLFFEDSWQDKVDPVEASELAALLIMHQVPITILNACQSGKQIGASETSLGSRLMQAGVQLVLAMGYSVTVTAAELLMRTLYRELFAKHDLSTAISMARHELYNRKERLVYYNQMLDLEDWLLPVVYQNQPVQLNIPALAPEELTRLHERNARRYSPSQPSYGFVGRDLDILQIEKKLLTRRNILLIRGMGGSGKTALLHHLGSWWQTTQFVKEVFYFGYDERVWTRQQILTRIARQLMSQVEYVTTFQPLSLDAQQSLLAQRLRAEPHLLILDNLESITGAHLAIQHTLSKKEQTALHRFIKDLTDGKSFVLLGSRGSEVWLSPETFFDNIYDLQGLDAEATAALAERILERSGATKYRQDKHLPILLTLLDGFPLALEVVLANLSRQSPEEVLKALQVGDVQLNVGDSQKRTENILRCIDYSHSNLSPETQSLLTCLAPFTTVLFLNIFDAYSTFLKEQAVLANLPFDKWYTVLEEATDRGLLQADQNQPRFLRLQPIFPYFLRTRLNSPEKAEVHKAIETAFLKLYMDWSSQLYGLLKSKDSQEIRLGILLVQYEYGNILSAVKLASEDHTLHNPPYYVLSEYFDLVQDPQRGLEVAEDVWERLISAKAKQSHNQANEVLVSALLGDFARWHLHLKHFTQAEEYYQKDLQIHVKNNDRHSQAVDYTQLGMAALEQGHWEKAEAYFQQALQIFIESNNRSEQAGVYQKLGIVAQSQGKFDQAEAYYHKDLRINIENNDSYEQAISYHQLGSVYQAQGKLEQAEKYLLLALPIFIEYKNHRFQANAYHNLGIVALNQGKFDQAERYLQLDLSICIELNDRYSQASTYVQLATIDTMQGKYEQAEAVRSVRVKPWQHGGYATG